MMKRKIIEAKTFTPLYDEMEDRIRLIVNYKDPYNRIDLMITRAFIIKMVPFLEDYLERNIDNFLLQNEKIEKELKYKIITQKDYLDLIIKEELLKEINLSLLKDKFIILSTFISENTEVKAYISANFLKELLISLKKVIPKYSWGIYL